MGRDKQGSPTLRCTQYILYRERPYMRPGLCPFSILCQSRGNPTLPPTVPQLLLGDLGGDEREHTGSREEPVCRDGVLCLVQKPRVVVFPCWPTSANLSTASTQRACAADERARYAQGISHHLLQDQRRPKVVPALGSLRPVARRLVPHGLRGCWAGPPWDHQQVNDKEEHAPCQPFMYLGPRFRRRQC